MTPVDIEDATIKATADRPQDREPPARGLVEGSGGKLHHYHLMPGEYDGLAVVEFPDNASAAATGMRAGASGAFALRDPPADDRAGGAGGDADGQGLREHVPRAERPTRTAPLPCAPTGSSGLGKAAHGLGARGEETAMAFDERAAIDRFWEARRTGDYFPADWRDRLSFEQAYRVQLGVVARRVAAGERQVGWKVAQTSEGTRRQFGFPEPIFGCLMEEGLRRSGHSYGRDELIRPGCEPEVCVRLGAPLSGGADAAAARRAIDALHPAFEVIELRGDIAAQKGLAIADNVAQKGVVLGGPVPLADGLDLAAMECRVLMNGGEAARGRGDAVLGDPVNSVVWLARKLAEFGLSLRAGDLIMTGSITRMFPLAPGDRARAEFEGIGAVEVGIAA